MKTRIVILDECTPRKWMDTLKSRGMITHRLKKGTPDYEMKKLADNMGAYVVTCDKGFNDYENALYIHPKIGSGRVYHMLDTLMRTEIS